MVSLVSEFKKTIKNDHILDPKTKFLIAVSGGLDSMCLLSLLGELDLNSKNVFVVYVDHQQRQESVIEENAVRDQAQLQGYNFLSQKIFVQELNNLSETQLRNLRYNSLEAIAAELKIGLVLTAHHLDDQAETFLMQIFRSGTVMGVKGIDRFSQRNGLSFYRPLINISKKQLLLYAQEKKIFFFEDETNLSDETMRNQIRHHIFNHDFLTDKEYHHFLNFCNEVSDLKRDTSNYYDLLIEKYQISKRSISLNVFSNSISYRNFIRHFLVKNGILQINTNLVGECSKLLHNPNKPQGLVQISSSLIFFKEYDHFGLKSAEQKETGVVPTFKFNQWFKVGNDELGIFELPLADSYKYQKKIPIVYSTQDPPFCWRYREPGDLIMIGDHRKKLRRFLIEKKVPKSKRDRLLILASGSKVLFLEKFGYSGLFNISKTDKITSVVLLR